MPDEPLISIATPDDAEAIHLLQRLAYQQEARLYNDFTIAPLRETLQELRVNFARMTFLKAICDNKIVGSVRAEQRDDTCYIGRLIVNPAYQRCGIGAALMQAIESHHPTAPPLELFTGHRSEGNIRLYQRLGYAIYNTEVVTPELSLVYLEKCL